MTVRMATGTAIALGLRKGKASPHPTTAHLLTPGRCVYDCAYCTKARTSTSPPDFMCRITWPASSESDVWGALQKGGSGFKRICIQVVNRPGCFDTARNWMSEIKSRCDMPVSIEIRTKSNHVITDLVQAGADCVGLPVDVASERLYPDLRGGELEEALKLLTSAARSFPRKISTHIIVGLGETDKEIVDVARRILGEDVQLALFAFTPCKGTRMESKEPPSLRRYRRIQIATHLISEDPTLGVEFDQEGRLILPRIGKEEFLKIFDKAFRTRGCEGCNRPFYNERPGRTPYNYPDRLSEEQVVKEAQVVLG